MVHFGRFRRKNQQIFSKFSVWLMAKSRFRLDVRRALKDGTYPVQIIVGHGTNIYLGTGVYASVGEWDARTQQYVGKGHGALTPLSFLCSQWLLTASWN